MLRKLLRLLAGSRRVGQPCQQCNSRQATFHITDAAGTGGISELHLCEPCAKSVLTKPYEPASASYLGHDTDEVPVEVERVVIVETHDQQLLVLREIGGARRLLLLIGIFEATSIDRRLRELTSPRPLTHDAWMASIDALGAQIQTACISGLSTSMEKTYLAELRLAMHGSQVRVDVRPSDAVAIAMISGSPLVIPGNVLTTADKAIEWRA